MRLKIDWASLIVGSKLTVFFCSTLCLRAIFQVQAPGALNLEGRFYRRYLFGGLMFGGAYTNSQSYLHYIATQIYNLQYFTGFVGSAMYVFILSASISILTSAKIHLNLTEN